MINQPTIFQLTGDQNKFVIGSARDGIYYDSQNNTEVDLDELYKVDLIRNITYDNEDQKFYFLTNKKDGQLGFFLIEFSALDPNDYKFLTMWQHKLDLDDANIYILRGKDAIGKGSDQNESYKELVISYKTCFINTYNIIV